MAASTKKSEESILEELFDDIQSEQHAKRELQVTYAKKGLDQLKYIMKKMYAMEDAQIDEKRECVALNGDCTRASCCGGMVCEKALEIGAKGTCVTCLKQGSRCGKMGYGDKC